MRWAWLHALSWDHELYLLTMSTLDPVCAHSLPGAIPHVSSSWVKGTIQR